MGCSGAKVTPAPDDAGIPGAPPPPLTEVRLGYLQVAEPFRWDQELRGLATATLELGLSDLPGVVALTPSDGPSPSLLVGRVPPQRVVDAALRCRGPAEALVFSLELCVAGSGCETHEATAPREAPYPAFAALLDGAAATLELPVTDAVRAAWATPGSPDPYAELVAGRAAAVYYGFLPVSASPGDRRRDPVARAPFLSPSQPVAQWIAGRWAVGADAEPGGAVSPLKQALLARPSSPVLAADLATVFEWSGRPDQAALLWDDLAQRLPDDPRWYEAHARVLIATGRAEDARRRLERLPPTFAWDPALARMRVKVAEALAEPDLDPLLEHWQRADARTAEPVLRRIELRVAAERYADALPLVSALRARAPGPTTDALEVALLAAVGNPVEAAERAPAEVARRLRARAVREGDPGALVGPLLPEGDVDALLLDAEVALARGDAAGALGLVGQALGRAPGRPEAVVLRARALDALGQPSLAAEAWAEAWAIDPALPGGPLRAGRIASALPVYEAPKPAPRPRRRTGPATVAP